MLTPAMATTIERETLTALPKIPGSCCFTVSLVAVKVVIGMLERFAKI